MMTFRSHAWVLVTFILMLLTIPASGDEIILRFDDSIGSSYHPYHNPDDSNAYMETYPGSSQFSLPPNTVVWGDEFWYYFPTFTVPAGQAIVSAKLKLSFATELQYSYEPTPVALVPLDPNQPSLPGRISITPTTYNSVVQLLAGECGPTSNNNFENFDLMRQGCDPLKNGVLDVSLFAGSVTYYVPTVLDPGFNAGTGFFIEGESWTPIAGELDVIYTPEPLPILRIGTGMLLVAGLAFRRGAHRPVACIH